MSETLKTIRDDIKDELDLNEDTWRDDSDINLMINKAIRKAHRKIVTIYESYFLANTTVTIAASDNTVSYPSDIYANKIKGIYFSFDSTVTEVKPIRDFSTVVMSNVVSDDSTGTRKYLSVDSLANGRQLRLYPDNGDAGDLLIWYIREARTLSEDTDICDIDEFVDYVKQVVKSSYYRLDSDPRYKVEKSEELELEKSMIDSLKNMYVDNNDEMLPDYSHYQDSV